MIQLFMMSCLWLLALMVSEIISRSKVPYHALFKVNRIKFNLSSISVNYFTHYNLAYNLTNPKSKLDDWVFIEMEFSNEPPTHPATVGKVSKKQDRAIYPKQKQ